MDRGLCWTAALLCLTACQSGPQAGAEDPEEVPDPPAEASALPNVPAERLRVRVLATYPHDRRAFTQGLVWHHGVLYESTGQYGASSVRRVAPRTGEVRALWQLDAGLFGEGLALVDDRLIQLTWQAGMAWVYDLATLQPLEVMTYGGEGWGLAWDGERLVTSDGSSRLSFRDPRTFAVLSTVEVALEGQPLSLLNELEFVAGALWANVWSSEQIVCIDPASGVVTAVVDASGLLEPGQRQHVDVLNGIAWDPVSETFWITGKYWPTMFQVVFEPAPKAAG